MLGGMTVAQHDIHQDHCDGRAGTCDQQGIDARESGETLGAVTTATLIISGGLLAAGVVLIFAAGDDEQIAVTSHGHDLTLAVTW